MCVFYTSILSKLSMSGQGGVTVRVRVGFGGGDAEVFFVDELFFFFFMCVC